MFEIIGYCIAFLFGFGWLWGRNEFKVLRKEDFRIYNCGGPFLWIGMFATLLLLALILAIGT